MKYTRTYLQPTKVSGIEFAGKLLLAPGFPAFFSFTPMTSARHGVVIRLRAAASPTEIGVVISGTSTYASHFYLDSTNPQDIYFPWLPNFDTIEIMASQQEVEIEHFSAILYPAPKRVYNLWSPLHLNVTIGGYGVHTNFVKDSLLITCERQREGRVLIAPKIPFQQDDVLFARFLSPNPIKLLNRWGLYDTLTGEAISMLDTAAWKMPFFDLQLSNNLTTHTTTALQLAVHNYYASAVERHLYGTKS
jgi:hypothetical protein